MLVVCSDEEGSGMADLQRMLQKVVSSKKASARQKQAELIKVSRRLPWAYFGCNGSHHEA